MNYADKIRYNLEEKFLQAPKFRTWKFVNCWGKDFMGSTYFRIIRSYLRATDIPLTYIHNLLQCLFPSDTTYECYPPVTCHFNTNITHLFQFTKTDTKIIWCFSIGCYVMLLNNWTVGREAAGSNMHHNSGPNTPWFSSAPPSKFRNHAPNYTTTATLSALHN